MDGHHAVVIEGRDLGAHRTFHDLGDFAQDLARVALLLQQFKKSDPVTAVFLACALTLLFGALVGFVNGFFVAKCKINALITTLASMQIVRGLGFIASDGRAIGAECAADTDCDSGDCWPALTSTGAGTGFAVWAPHAAAAASGVERDPGNLEYTTERAGVLLLRHDYAGASRAFDDVLSRDSVTVDLGEGRSATFKLDELGSVAASGSNE